MPIFMHFYINIPHFTLSFDAPAADYAIGGFYVMTPNGEGCEWPKCKVPVSPFAETIKVLSAHEAVIYMKFGPSGVDKKTGQSKQALYYVSRDGDMRGVHKIEFTGTADQRPRSTLTQPSVSSLFESTLMVQVPLIPTATS